MASKENPKNPIFEKARTEHTARNTWCGSESEANPKDFRNPIKTCGRPLLGMITYGIVYEYGK
jgi:hypothetical protein